MTEIDTQMVHQRAKEQHEARQMIDGLRLAVVVLRANMPQVTIQVRLWNEIIKRLEADVTEIERKLR